MAEVSLHWRGRTVVFDPAAGDFDDAIVVLTGSSPARCRGALAAVRAGRRPTVVCGDVLGSWLGSNGPIDRREPGSTLDGLRLQGLPFSAPPGATPVQHFLQASLAATRPRAVLRRLREEARMPAPVPHAWSVTFPDGSRLCHLDVALHGGTTDAWIDSAASVLGNAEWTLVGLPFGETAALARWLPRLGTNRVLVLESVNGERRELGLPTELVTPARDVLVAAGIEAHVFATQASYRFE
jgi:hypothetical protein